MTLSTWIHLGIVAALVVSVFLFRRERKPRIELEPKPGVIDRWPKR